MKNWTSRFVVMMVAGAIMCSAFMAGCPSSSDEEATNTPAVNKPATDPTNPE